jgi:chemotaxis protein histidine kinase CheA
VSDDLGDIVQEFLVESHENLDQLDRDLVALEAAPGSRELLSSIFRTIHTIKGTSGFLAFNRLEKVTHVGESLLSRLRDGTQGMTPSTTDALLRMVDTVRGLLSEIEEHGREPWCGYGCGEGEYRAYRWCGRCGFGGGEGDDVAVDDSVDAGDHSGVDDRVWG